MNYLLHLLKSKGIGHLGQRALSISQRYGTTPGKMMLAFEQLVDTLDQCGCPGTFPITAAALDRNPAPARWLQSKGMELAAHGWTHVNLEQHPFTRQVEHLTRARQVLRRHGIEAAGFRSPYLCHGDTIGRAAEAAGFRYVSNQPILWDGGGGPKSYNPAYHKAVTFYRPWSPAERPALPFMRGAMVELPVSLPDDEMLVERLGACSAEIAETWCEILQQTYLRGELFVLQLHPERAAICVPALRQVLARARACDPPVWLARLDEVARWWQQRSALQAQALRNGDATAAEQVPCWPGGARSALAVSGDIDVLTVWDYAWRLFGR